MTIKGVWVSFMRQPWDKRMLWSAAVLALLPIGLAYFSRSAEAPPPDLKMEASADTHIPRGFVLIPIEAQNYEALDSVLGRFGVVDLYQGHSGAPDQRLVARNVRILRAPHNPSHFAVLVPESEASHVLRQGGVFTVIVKRRSESGTEFVKEAAKGRRSIVYEGG